MTLRFEGIQGFAAGLAVGKIVLHSVLLFLILRARLEPLLRLRAVVSSLSKAYGALSQRAEIQIEDEFGVLAGELNIFLDRINLLTSELNQVLLRVVAVNDDFVTVQDDLRGQIDRVVTGVRRLERDAMLAAKREPRLSNDWFKAIRSSIQSLDDMPQADALLEELRDVVASAETQLAKSEKLFDSLAVVGDDTDNLKGAMSEMTRLEEWMKTIIETGGTLVRRLQPEVGQSVKRRWAFPAVCKKRRWAYCRSVEPHLAHVDPGVVVATIGNDRNGCQATRFGYSAQQPARGGERIQRQADFGPAFRNREPCMIVLPRQQRAPSPQVHEIPLVIAA